MALGALAATVLWMAVLGWQSAYAPNEKEREQCNESAKHATHKTEECKSIWEKTTTDPVAFFTSVLSVSTIGLWLATVGLGVAARRTDERQSTETEITQRAYISVAPAECLLMRPVTRLSRAMLRFPMLEICHARNVAWFIGRIFSDSSIEKDFPIGPVEGNIVVPARIKLRKGSKAISFDDFDSERPIGNGEKWLYVYGRIEYSDGFKAGRSINFCHRYNMKATLGGTGREIQQWDARYHVHGNHTDEEAGTNAARFEHLTSRYTEETST